jgi:signal transduction histidine kinase
LKKIKQDNSEENSLYKDLFEKNEVEERNVVNNQFKFTHNEKIYKFDVVLLSIEFNNTKCIATILKDETVYLKLQKEKLKRKYQKKLMAKVTHELRTPLNGIISMFDLLQLKVTEKSLQKYIKVGKNGSYLLLNLINDILDFAQIEAQELKISISNFNVQDLLDECCDLVEFQIHKKHLQLEMIVNPNVPRIVCSDKNRYRQILLNLFSNAIKFTFQGSIQIEVWFQLQDSLLFTSVRDSGIGISLEDQDKLFTQFGKLENARQFNSQGWV